MAIAKAIDSYGLDKCSPNYTETISNELIRHFTQVANF